MIIILKYVIENKFINLHIIIILNQIKIKNIYPITKELSIGTKSSLIGRELDLNFLQCFKRKKFYRFLRFYLLLISWKIYTKIINFILIRKKYFFLIKIITLTFFTKKIKFN